MLRPYQLDAVNGLRHSIGKKEFRRVLLQLPTGGGKTVVASEIVRGAVEKGNPVLFIAHRRELIHQAAAKLREFGIASGLVLAGEKSAPYELVQVGSIQTIASRLKRGAFELPEAAVVIIDEAHHAVAKSYMNVVEAYPDAVILGLTATPVRGDGKGLGHLFQDMVFGPTIPFLTQEGFLVEVRYYAPSMPDLRGVKLVAGDYNQHQLEDRMDKPKLVGDVVANWGSICPDRQTVVFATSVKHSMHLAEEFRAMGVNAAHLDGETPLDERAGILSDLSSGRLQVVTNCMVLTEGWDQPDVSCCVLARPTKSLGLYLQMAGRVLRPSPGKADTMLIDHSGSVYQHGFLHEPFEWSLDTEGKIGDREAKRKNSEPNPITCEKCFTIYEKQHVCPACGHMPERHGRGVQQIEGTLGEVGQDRSAERKVYRPEEKRTWYAMFKHIQLDRGRQPGWTAHTFKDKFGVWPKGMDSVEPIPPSLEVERFVKHKAIRFAKSRKNQPPPSPLFGT